MKTKTPIKRHPSLQPLSRDHHQGLLLCWKIRTGIAKNIPFKSIKKYTDWFYKNHITPHFKVEEEIIFPILGNNDELVKKALADHRRLNRLFTDIDEIEKSLSQLEEELEKHIRFEERSLFQAIQSTASSEQLQLIKNIHKGEKFIENTEDEFWK